MQSKILFFILFLLLLPIISACHLVEGDVQAVGQMTPMETAPIQDYLGAENPSPDAEEDAAPAPTLVSVPENLSQAIACGETLCQVQWPGLLGRPIGPQDTIMVDRTYLYASTRNQTLDPHHGVEFPNAFGTPVLAAQEGEVIFAGNDDLTVLGPYTGFYGTVIILRHPSYYDGRDLFTLYAHLSEMMVVVGEQVNLWDTIGKVGASGAADGSHLHFEVRLGENDYDHTINPVLLFSPISSSESSEGGAVLVGVLLDHQGQPLSEFQVTLEKLGEDGSVEAYYYPQTYSRVRTNGYPVFEENLVVPDLPTGEYRLSYISGTLVEYFFTLEPNSLGFIKLQLN